MAIDQNLSSSTTLSIIIHILGEDDDPFPIMYQVITLSMSIREFLLGQQVRSGRIAQLKAVGGLGTCGCCFDDELLPEDQLILIGRYWESWGGGQNLQILPNSSPKDLDGFRFRFRITPQIELERDMCEWMVGHDLSMFDIQKGQMFCVLLLSHG